MVTIPKEYSEARARLGCDEVSFNIGGIHLFPIVELKDAQLGYSVGIDGNSLCTGEPGDWKEEWLVIGHETAMGDPILIDTTDPKLSVLADAHGQGYWEPEKVSESLTGFLRSLEVFRSLSSGRENPVLVEANPLSQDERRSGLEKIREADPTANLAFWEGIYWIDDQVP